VSYPALKDEASSVQLWFCTSSLICWFGGLTAPSITMRAMFMFAFCKKAFLTLLAILAVDGKVFSYKTYKTYKAYCILRLKGGTFGDKKEDRF
jgi:hypothetical protein